MTDSTPPPAPAPAAPRWMRVALVVSLALNLGVAGVMIGAAFHGGPEGPPGFQREMGFGPFSEALRPEDRKALRRALFARAPDLREARRQMRGDMEEMLEALRADPFDPARLSALLDGQHQRMIGQLTLGEELIRDFLLKLDPTERLAFADRLEKQLRHGPPEGKGPRDGDAKEPPPAP